MQDSDFKDILLRFYENYGKKNIPEMVMDRLWKEFRHITKQTLEAACIQAAMDNAGAPSGSKLREYIIQEIRKTDLDGGGTNVKLLMEESTCEMCEGSGTISAYPAAKAGDFAKRGQTYSFLCLCPVGRALDYRNYPTWDVRKSDQWVLQRHAIREHNAPSTQQNSEWASFVDRFVERIKDLPTRPKGKPDGERWH